MQANGAILESLRTKKTTKKTNESGEIRKALIDLRKLKGKTAATFESATLRQLMSKVYKMQPTQIVERTIDTSLDNLSIMAHVNGSRYIGEKLDGMPHGYGTGVTPDGDMYNGDWFCGLPHGEGIYYWTDGVVYIGMWRNGIRHGRGGYLIDDETYLCEFENDKLISLDGEIVEKVFIKKKALKA